MTDRTHTLTVTPL